MSCITLLAIFRDVENYLKYLFPKLITLENKYKIIYVIYENDSQDNTKHLLREWMKDRSGVLVCEDLNESIRPRKSNRSEYMAHLRNKCLALHTFDTKITILLDADIYFPYDGIDMLLEKLKTYDYVGAYAIRLEDYFVRHYYDTISLSRKGKIDTRCGMWKCKMCPRVDTI